MGSKRRCWFCTIVQLCTSEDCFAYNSCYFKFRGCAREKGWRRIVPPNKYLLWALWWGWVELEGFPAVHGILFSVSAVPLVMGSPEPWIWMSSEDRLHQSHAAPCLSVGAAICCCFSSLMRAEHTIKFYWVFMLTKLTNSCCFKNAAGAPSTITGVCSGFLTGVGQSKCVSADVI